MALSAAAKFGGLWCCTRTKPKSSRRQKSDEQGRGPHEGLFRLLVDEGKHVRHAHEVRDQED